jgi:hypothetical protein
VYAMPSVAELLDVRDPTILQASLLLGVLAVVGERGPLVDDPVRRAVAGAGAGGSEKPRRSSTRRRSTV